MTDGRAISFRGWLARRTTTQLSVMLAVVAALALAGSLLLTGQAARTDMREQAALAALDDYGAMISKLGVETSLSAENLTEADTAYLSAWLTAFQGGRVGDVVTLEETCRSGRGGAGVRLIRAPVGKPAGLAALETTRAQRMTMLGEDIYLVRLAKGELCSGRAVEVILVHRTVGALDIRVGRTVDQSGKAWGRAALTVGLTGVLMLAAGLTAAILARRRLAAALLALSRSLDRAALGDFSERAPEIGAAPELTELTAQVNQTLDRLEELLAWLRDSADQLAHDFRTPLARAKARLTALGEATDAAERERLRVEAEDDLGRISRAMTEAMALRDGEAWAFEAIRLDELARAAVALYEPLAEARGVSLMAEGDEATVLGVRSLLQRAAANLVDNALKFSPDGGRVRLWSGIEAGEVVLSVADQGPGFGAAPPQAAAAPESHGMGLSFVRAVMRRHGGRLTTADGEPGVIAALRFPPRSRASGAGDDA